MASTIAITCPKCEKKINAPAELEGKKIRCKECKHVFTVEVPAGGRTHTEKSGKAEKEPVTKKPSSMVADEDREARPYEVTDHEFLPRCPYCAKELEYEGAVICLNCGYNTQTRERVASKKTYEMTGGDVFLWLLPGILSALGLLTMIGCIVMFWVLFPRWYEDTGWSWFFFGLHSRIWNTVICCFIGFFCGKFAFKRLILDNKPPEKEKKK